MSKPGPRVSSPAALELAHTLAATVETMEASLSARTELEHVEIVEALACMPDAILESLRDCYTVAARKTGELSELAHEELRRRGRVHDG